MLSGLSKRFDELVEAEPSCHRLWLEAGSGCLECKSSSRESDRSREVAVVVGLLF